MSPLHARQLHEWNLSPEQAIQVQEELRGMVRIEPLDLSQVRSVAGVDAGFGAETVRASVVVLSFPALEKLEEHTEEVPLTFPYIPGLLSFREAPAILKTLQVIERTPDVILFDGQGLAHPRRMGIACHVGVLLDIPAVGCAKSILTGKHAPLGEERGSLAELRVRAEIVGMAVRTKDRVKPVYVSVGHRVDLASAVELTLACSAGYRLPEPTRLADRLASQRDK